MRILHILDHSVPIHSGYSFRTLSILREQRRLGWETTQLTGGKQRSEQDGAEEAEGLCFLRTGQPSNNINRLPALNQYAIVSALERRILQIAKEWPPDILHAHSPALNGLAGLRASRRLKIPLVYEVRAFWEDAAVDLGTTRENSLRYRLTRALESHVLRRATAVTTICDGLKSEMEMRGIDRSRITVIPNAVDIERFDDRGDKGAIPAALAERLRGKTVLGFIGSFYAYEGLDLLLQALPIILKHQPDIHLLLVGGGPQEHQLKQLCAELGIEDSVTFTGRVPQNNVADYYRVADVLVYPRYSIRLTELVTPLKPLEAMAYGRPVVASDIGGHRELIRSGENGVLFQPGDVTQLAQTIRQFIGNSAALKKITDAGKAFVREQRNWPASVARYQDVYESALNENRSRYRQKMCKAPISKGRSSL